MSLPKGAVLLSEPDHDQPKWIADNKQCDIFLVRVPQDLFALCLDHIAVRKDQLLPVERFLGKNRVSASHPID